MKTLSIHLEAIKKSHFTFLKWLRLVFAFAILSIIMLCCAPKSIIYPSPEAARAARTVPPPPPSSACRIPSDAKIIHYPMVHSIDESIFYDVSYPRPDERFIEESIIYSQFHLARLIEKMPDTHIFGEGTSESMGPEDLANSAGSGYVTREGGRRVLWRLSSIQKTFRRGLPASLQDLNAAQKKILLELGGVSTAFAIGAASAIYRVISPDESSDIHSRIKSTYEEQVEVRKDTIDLLDQFEEDPDNTQLEEDLTDSIDHLIEIRQNLDKWLFDEREAILKREVERVLKNSKKKVLIAFGAQHDLSDDFKNYSFFALPEKCTMAERFLSHPYYAFHLIGRADRISEDKKSSSKQLKMARLDYKQAHSILTEAVKKYTQDSDKTSYWSHSLGRYYTKAEIENMAQRSHNKQKGRDDESNPYYLALSKILRFH